MDQTLAPVTIVGGGFAGVECAYQLARRGYKVTVFESLPEPGGMLRYGVPEASLSRDVLAAEIAQIQKLGVVFRLGTRVGVAVSMDEIRRQFDAVFIGTGELKPGDAEVLGIAVSPEGIKIDSQTDATSVPGIFAGGDATRKRRLAIRAVADGKDAAESIRQYLVGDHLKAEGPVCSVPVRAFQETPHGVTTDSHAFISRMGRLQEGEMAIFLQSAGSEARQKPSGPSGGFTDEEARAEALRCLHCDCRKPGTCLLRQHAQLHDARQSRYRAERRRFVQQTQHADIIYEPGKCIDCGICIQIATQAGEKLGLTFIGRGFDVRVAVPFNETLAEGLKIVAVQCVQACPTGALAFKDAAKTGHEP
jgi:ferredoxin